MHIAPVLLPLCYAGLLAGCVSAQAVYEGLQTPQRHGTDATGREHFPPPAPALSYPDYQRELQAQKHEARR